MRSEIQSSLWMSYCSKMRHPCSDWYPCKRMLQLQRDPEDWQPISKDYWYVHSRWVGALPPLFPIRVCLTRFIVLGIFRVLTPMTIRLQAASRLDPIEPRVVVIFFVVISGPCSALSRSLGWLFRQLYMTCCFHNHTLISVLAGSKPRLFHIMLSSWQGASLHCRPVKNKNFD